MNTGNIDGFHGEMCAGATDKFNCIEKIFGDNKAGMAIISMPDLILLKTNQMHIAYLEEPYNKIDQITGKCLKDIAGPWSRHLNKKDMDDLIREHKVKYLLEVKMKMKDGQEKYFNNILSPVEEDGETRYILSILMDVTEKVQCRQQIQMAAQTIQLEKEELEAVIDNLNDAIFIFRNEKLYLQNSVSKKYFGGHKIEIPKDIYDAARFYNSQGERLTYERMPLNRMLDGEGSLKEDVLMECDGDIKYLTITGTSLPDKEGRPSLHIVNCRDATDRALSFLTIMEQKKQLDQELEAERYRAELLKTKMQENESFFSYISHEFRTPLTVINSALQALDFTCRNELPPKAEKYLNSIRQNSYRLLRLMNNILDLNRAEAGFLKAYSVKTDAVALTKNIVDSVTIYAKQKDIDLNFISRFKSMDAVLDQTKYERILLNLLSNAVKFTPPGKSIFVNISFRDGNMILKVRDEGVGIPADKQKELFNRYSQVSNDLTRPSEGAGIGLSLVKQLVMSMNGDIRLESCEGKGSTFTVSLPVEKPKEINETAITAINLGSYAESARIEFS
ncbi:MAG TPA: PAS domain-containing sensor histidine kinase [Clostridia bacterium]|nr:PAS domain-containing sensor histidine kinase [Clostridia bacterium]